jgi:hypothetical protein
MSKFSNGKKILFIIYTLCVLWVFYHFFARPAILDWGANKELQDLKLSGDIFTNGERHTRAVLINARPEQIWPWLMQLGQERGGFYSHEWLENLFFADMKNVYAIKKEFQQPRHVGDTVWLANKEHYNGGGYQIIAEITPLSSYVMVSGPDFVRINEGQQASGSWAFYLYPQSDSTTWFIARSSGAAESLGERVLRYFTFEVPHFIMEAKMLKTVKHLVETS